VSWCRAAEVKHPGKAGRSPSSGAGREVWLRGNGGVCAARCRGAEVESFARMCVARCKAARASSRAALPFPR
jgi:hypothetical protein